MNIWTAAAEHGVREQLMTKKDKRTDRKLDKTKFTMQYLADVAWPWPVFITSTIVPLSENLRVLWRFGSVQKDEFATILAYGNSFNFE